MIIFNIYKLIILIKITKRITDYANNLNTSKYLVKYGKKHTNCSGQNYRKANGPISFQNEAYSLLMLSSELGMCSLTKINTHV